MASGSHRMDDGMDSQINVDHPHTVSQLNILTYIRSEVYIYNIYCKQ